MRNIISAAKHRRRKRDDEIWEQIGKVTDCGTETIKLVYRNLERISILVKRINELNTEVLQCKNAIAEIQNMIIDSRVEND